jgi:hypothetical protein
MLAFLKLVRIFRGGLLVIDSATYFSRPTPTTLPFAQSGGLVPPHPSRVDHYNEPYPESDHAPNKRCN